MNRPNTLLIVLLIAAAVLGYKLYDYEMGYRDTITEKAYYAGLYDACEFLRIGEEQQRIIAATLPKEADEELATEIDKIYVGWSLSLHKGGKHIRELMSNLPSYSLLKAKYDAGKYSEDMESLYLTTLYGTSSLTDIVDDVEEVEIGSDG